MHFGIPVLFLYFYFLTILLTIMAFCIKINIYNILGALQMIKISPSVLTADFLTLKDDIKKLELAGVDMLHLDVMDGLFVPNISFGAPIIRSIRKHTDLPLDVHLMIDRPHRYLKEFAEDADYLGFHYEAGSNVKDLLKDIQSLGKKSCLTIKPKTEPEEIF